MENHIEQIGLLVLQDGPDICVVASDLRHDEGEHKFMIHNERTGSKYNVTIRVEEI